MVEFSEYGNLSEAIPHLSASSVLQEVVQIASALEYLERKKLLHRGISPATIFVVGPNKVGAADLVSVPHVCTGSREVMRVRGWR